MATSDVVDNSTSQDDSWSHWEEALEEAAPLFDALPPDTMKRVSSCYLSLPSESSNSLNELWSLWEDAATADTKNNKKNSKKTFTTDSADESFVGSSDVLYHDILMNVFSFLDTKSLAAFSETATRSNMECYQFLQLQLENTLHEEDSSSDTLTQVASLRRLAQHDRAAADTIVQEYIQSNTSIRRNMNLAYCLRQLLVGQTRPTSSQALAALLLTVVAALNMTDHHTMAAELPNMLFKVGFLGSLMGAAKTMSNRPMRERAEQMALKFQEHFHDDQRFPSLMKLLQAAYDAAYGNANNNSSTPFTPSDESSPEEENLTPKLVPTGCVGDFSRATSQATHLMTSRIQQERRQRFQDLSEEEQRQVSSSFIDACCSDDSFQLVKELVQVRGTIDVEGFYVGSDGTETCGLHAAAFHGATQILEFLCQGIEDNGGLCNVNLQDANGWSAVHFAAGANSVQAVRILTSYGAALSVEASNGYTPLQWALRLQNAQVAEELRLRIGTEQKLGWMSRQPLSAIANRFLAMIPSH